MCRTVCSLSDAWNCELPDAVHADGAAVQNCVLTVRCMQVCEMSDTVHSDDAAVHLISSPLQICLSVLLQSTELCAKTLYIGCASCIDAFVFLELVHSACSYLQLAELTVSTGKYC